MRVERWSWALVLWGVLSSCSDAAEKPRAAATASTPVTHHEELIAHEPPAQVITIDGSSTVYLINEAVAEEFQKTSSAKVTIGVSGTGGGFKKLCAGDVTIVGASRPIKPVEAHDCAGARIDFIELPVGYDGLAMVVHPQNDWAKDFTVQDLKRIWEPAAQARVKTWHDIRAEWPDKPLHLFGPGVDSGTYDYFTKAIIGEEHSSRGDFTSSEDDNVLVQGIASDPFALGYFGLAYYVENTDKLRLVPVDDGDDRNGKGPIAASEKSVHDGTYQPLSRPLFIYVNKAAAERAEVQTFIRFYLSHGETLVKEARYVPLPRKAYELAQERFDKRLSGSLFTLAGGSQIGITLESLLARQ